MQYRVEPLRDTDPHISLSKEDARQFIFVHYEHTITALEASDGLEWWFPISDGDGYHTIIRNASLKHKLNITGPGSELVLYVQSPDEQTRLLIHDFGNLAGEEPVAEFIVPHGARGILRIIGGKEGDLFRASYLVERVR
jgi:hypothetical protein